jgi:alpha-methylacyl-CoA racemase
MDKGEWARVKQRFEQTFATRTRAEWCALLEGTDACFAPVLSFAEAAEHPHNRVRGVFVDVAGSRQPAPAPRFSRTPSGVSRPPSHPGQDTDEALGGWGFSDREVAGLRRAGAVR